jgi:NADPH:quinone reductase-like Zn-dependent oxidoreductase
MRAFTLDDFDATPALRDLPAPVPGEGELLIRVRASSVNPVDAAIAAGMLRGMVEHELPIVLGRDFAGVVEQAGEGATRFAPGDAVFGFVRHAAPAVRDGSWAELISVPESSVAAVPSGVDVHEAGATPLAGITALFAVDALELRPGQTVLIVGATGGVGSFAIQLAVHAGARVIAPGYARDEDHLRALGVSEVLDRDGDVAAAVRSAHPDGVDALIDLVSYTPDAFELHAAALADGGRAASPLPGVGEGPGRFPILASPDPAALDRLAGLLDAGTLRVPVQHTSPLEQAGEAMAALSAEHTQGKRAIAVG